MSESTIFGFRLLFTDEVGIKHSLGEIAIKSDPWLSHFKYQPGYLSNEKTPDLCPLHFRKSIKNLVTNTRAHSGLPFPIEDIVPDAWGRALLVKKYSLPKARQVAPYFLGLVDDPIGALSIKWPPRGNWNIERKPEGSFTPLNLGEYLEAATAFEEGVQLDPQLLSILCRAGSSGGARPKVTCSIDGELWLAKFRSREDKFAMIPAESVCLSLAEALEIPVPENKLIRINGSPVLLMKRFDVTPENGRHHVISMRTLCEAEDLSGGSYEEIAEIIRRVSFDPEGDLKCVFRQMLLNVAVANIDDHLKNFSMLFEQNKGWRMSEAYDITPAALANPSGGGGFHSIGFLTKEAPETTGAPPTDWAEVADAFGFGSITRNEHIEAVRDAVLSNIDDLCDGASLPAHDAEAFIETCKSRVDAFLPARTRAYGITL